MDMKSRINHSSDWELAERDINRKSKGSTSKRTALKDDLKSDTMYQPKKVGRKSKHQAHKNTPGASERELVCGTVVVAHVNYADESGGWKTRPALVIGVKHRVVYVMPITSASYRDRYLGIEIEPKISNGLSKKSRVQARAVEIDRVVDIVGIIGTLDEDLLISAQLLYSHILGEHVDAHPSCSACFSTELQVLDDTLRGEVEAALAIATTPAAPPGGYPGKKAKTRANPATVAAMVKGIRGAEVESKMDSPGA